MTDDVRPEPDQPEAKRNEAERPELEGPAADSILAEEASKAAASDTFEQAIDGLIETDRQGDVRKSETADDSEVVAEAQPGKLERLQKILAQAGIASRRHAEELITQGRVQVNGKVVTELGTKADAGRDHIRVDGKLLQGSERLRYFMLNKPKGFVTTVSDPEGRPTIMEFFSKMRERLYPVGRLDYLSEGLLLVTNDGELANKLTRAASGVEKTYLVKVSGQPSEEAIDRLREGVGIERGKPGSGRVQSAPAEIHKVRQGDNPWYEVVLIEGRNRELRKMFEEIGHHVEKIRRVGYGPLVLDLEPGKLRELDLGEVENLRKAAEGKYRKPKAREPRKRLAGSATRLPSAKPRWNDRRGREGAGERAKFHRPGQQSRSDSSRGQGQSRGPNRGPSRGPAPGASPNNERGAERPFPTRPAGEFRSKPRFESARPSVRDSGTASPRRFGGPPENRGRRPVEGQSREGSSRPTWNKPERGSRPPRESRPADRAGSRPNRFHRPDGGEDRSVERTRDRRPPGEFRPRPAENRGPQRPGAKHPGSPTGFPGKRRFEIVPAEENFGGPQAGGPPRQDRRLDRRPYKPGSGPRPAPSRSSSAPGFEKRPSISPSINRGPEERPRFDRPRPAGNDRRQSDERPKSGPRSGGFRRPGAGGRGRSAGTKTGSGRSGGGRRPGSRPGGRPGGGKKRP